MRMRRAYQGMQGTNPSDTTCPISRRMDISCCWGGDLSVVRRGKVAVVGGRVCLFPGFAQIADHLTHNSPFLPFFGEVVCTLGGTLPYESHSCRRCVDSMLLMPPPPPNRPGSGYHRARECSSSAQRRPGPKLMPRGHSANRLFRTRAACSACGRGCPVSE